jgi:sortase A
VKASLPPQFTNGLLRYGQYVFAVIGIVALGYWAFVFVNGRLFQSKGAHGFAQGLQTQVTIDEKDARFRSTEIGYKSFVEGAAIAMLSISRLGLSTVVVEGVEDGDLKLAPGHIPGTAIPGEPGNVGIAGHRDTFFRPLRFIHKDDVIRLSTQNGEERYRVVSIKIVDPDDVQVLYPTNRETLTLVTCYPFYYVGSAPKRFIVRSERFEEP